MQLNELEQEVLEYMADGTEPTWIFLKERPELELDREKLERILFYFEARGLVARTREPSGNPDAEDPLEPENWWALTAQGDSLVRDST